MKINEEKVRHLADLSKLDLKDEEISKYKNEFTKIVDYLDQVKEADTSEYEYKNQHKTPQTYKDLRKDEPKKSLSQSDVTKNAEDKKNGMISVPKVVN